MQRTRADDVPPGQHGYLPGAAADVDEITPPFATARTR